MKVSTVIDGDTVELENGETVRLIGINAPEAGRPCYTESKNKLEELTKGKTVKLERDVVDKDIYNRLLGYIYVDDTFVNLEIVRLGFAHAYEYGSNTKYSTQFKQAEDEAKQNEGCLWKSEEINYIQDRCIYITNFHFNAAGNDNYNLNDEYVTFKNKCSYSIDMTSWTVKDETASHLYTFPPFVFQAVATFTLYTGTGVNTNSAVYWGRTSGNYAAIWNNEGGDTLFLRDSSGNLVLSQSYSGY
jgi:micrococcal nuclease